MKKDIKLLAIGVLVFIVVPLLASTTTTKYSSCPRQPVYVKTNAALLKKQPKLIACSATIIPYIWTIHYQCTGGGYGGGGGRAF